MSRDRYTDLLARIQAAQSDEVREWLVMQFALENLPHSVQEAIWAAAIPHWFDCDFLAAMLEKSCDFGEYQTILGLSFIEPFQGRGFNVHERSRTLLLVRLWRDDPARYRELSERAARYCMEQNQRDTLWRIETIYHLLIARPDFGIKELYKTGKEWQNIPNYYFAKVEAIVCAVREHAIEGRLTPPGLSWAQFWEANLDKIFYRNLQAKEKLLQIKFKPGEDVLLTTSIAETLGDVHIRLDEYNQARERYEQALSLYRDIGDRLGVATCIRSLGAVNYMLSKYKQAEDYYEQALNTYRDIGDHLGIATCIRSLGNVNYMQKKFDQARERYAQALPIYQNLSDRLGEANCIRSLGDVHIRLAEHYKARGQYEQALSIYKDIGSRVGVANCLFSLGEVNFRFDEYLQARELYEQALSIYRDINSRAGEANCMRSLGDVHIRLAEDNQARERYEQALSIYLDIDSRIGVANCIFSLGDVCIQLEEYHQARERYEKALSIYRDFGDRFGETNCIRSLGDVHIQLDEYPQAQARYEKALSFYRDINSRAGEANCIFSLGDLHIRLDEHLQARERYEQALSIFSDINSRLGEANCIRALGDVYYGMEQWEQAIMTIEKACDIFHKLGARKGEASCFKSIGNVFFVQKRYTEALASFERAIELFPDAVLFCNRANIYIDMDEYGSAWKDLDAVEARKQGQPLAAFLRGRIALYMKKPTEAVEFFQYAISQLPSRGIFRLWLGFAWAVTGKEADALAELEQGISSTYVARDVMATLEALEKLGRVYGDILQAEKMRQLLLTHFMPKSL